MLTRMTEGANWDQQPQRQSPLDHESLEFKVEPFEDIASEALPLAEAHFKELAPYKGDNPQPNWDWYFNLARQGILTCFTARYEGILVGYIVIFITTHMQFGHKHADAHMFWLDPAFRTGWNGIKFFRFMEDVLKEEKVQYINIEHTIHKDLSPLFKRLGYKPTFVIHSKELK